MTINRFENCHSRADYLRRFIDLENELSPFEMQALWQDRQALPDYLMAPLGKTIEMMAAGAPGTRPYMRIPMAANVTLFRAPGARAGKSLLIGFGGNGNRLMLPTPVFLQFIPETSFDVLFVRDPSHFGYLQGVPGFADTLAGVVDEIRARVDLTAYADTRCIGTSGGGSAALYAGLMLEANRAISVCGKHRSLSRHVTGNRNEGGAFTGDEFDAMVRDRVDRLTTRLLLVFGEKCPRDVEGAQSLLRYLPRARSITIKRLDDHNALLYLLQRRGLHDFFERFLINRLPAESGEE